MLPSTTDGRSARDVALECARVARDIIRSAAGGPGHVHQKGRGNVVTETDYRVEAAVTALIRAAFPTHAIMSEESAANTRSDGWLWVIDPLDGTKNFSRGNPHFAFTLALCYELRPLLGVTTHPVTGLEVVAEAGAGCTVNGRTARVSMCPSVLDAVVAMDLGYDADRAREQLHLAAHLWPGMQSLRIPGSAALGFAGLAAGSWDVYAHADLQPWDLAAGLIIVAEAGGEIREFDGRPATLRSRAVVAGNAGLVADFLARAAPSSG